MWPGGRLRMVLHRENGELGVRHTLGGLVVEVDVRGWTSRGKTRGLAEAEFCVVIRSGWRGRARGGVMANELEGSPAGANKRWWPGRCRRPARACRAASCLHRVSVGSRSPGPGNNKPSVGPSPRDLGATVTLHPPGPGAECRIWPKRTTTWSALPLSLALNPSVQRVVSAQVTCWTRSLPAILGAWRAWASKRRGSRSLVDSATRSAPFSRTRRVNARVSTPSIATTPCFLRKKCKGSTDCQLDGVWQSSRTMKPLKCGRRLSLSSAVMP